MAEKRKFIRFDSDLDALQCHEVFGAAAEKIKSCIKDLSREGLKLLATNALPKGSSVELEIEIPGDNIPAFVFSEVIWSRQTGDTHEAGLRFTKIEPHDQTRLLDYAYAAWQKFLKHKPTE